MKALLVVIDFIPKHGNDYVETFPPVVKHAIIKDHISW